MKYKQTLKMISNDPQSLDLHTFGNIVCNILFSL